MPHGTTMANRTRALEGSDDTALEENRVPCAELLCESQLFAGLSARQMNAIMPICRQMYCCQCRILFTESDEPADVFVVLEGEVTVELKLFRDFHLRPKAVTVEKIGSGGVIGCCALIEPCSINMTARCTKDSEIVAINAGMLRRFLAAHPDIGLIVMENAFRRATNRLVLARQQLVAQFGLSEMYQKYRDY
jgi:CRP-like cAMP-binding protein